MGTYRPPSDNVSLLDYLAYRCKSHILARHKKGTQLWFNLVSRIHTHRSRRRQTRYDTSFYPTLLKSSDGRNRLSRHHTQSQCKTGKRDDTRKKSPKASTREEYGLWSSTVQRPQKTQRTRRHSSTVPPSRWTRLTSFFGRTKRSSPARNSKSHHKVTSKHKNTHYREEKDRRRKRSPSRTVAPHSTHSRRPQRSQTTRHDDPSWFTRLGNSFGRRDRESSLSPQTKACCRDATEHHKSRRESKNKDISHKHRGSATRCSYSKHSRYVQPTRHRKQHEKRSTKNGEEEYSRRTRPVTKQHDSKSMSKGHNTRPLVRLSERRHTKQSGVQGSEFYKWYAPKDLTKMHGTRRGGPSCRVIRTTRTTRGDRSQYCL